MYTNRAAQPERVSPGAYHPPWHSVVGAQCLGAQCHPGHSVTSGQCVPRGLLSIKAYVTGAQCLWGVSSRAKSSLHQKIIYGPKNWVQNQGIQFRNNLTSQILSDTDTNDTDTRMMIHTNADTAKKSIPILIPRVSNSLSTKKGFFKLQTQSQWSLTLKT